MFNKANKGVLVIALPRFFQLLATEIQRRKVFRVVASYALTAWIVVQVVDTAIVPLGLPDWAMRSLVITAIGGFPVSFVLAWIVDATPDGLVLDLPLWVGDSDHPRPARKTDLIYAALLGVLLAGGTVYLLSLLSNDTGETSSPDLQATAPPNSVAVLVFENLGGASETDNFGAGLAEEILNSLASIRELNVVARTSSFRFQGEAIDVREIAQLLNVRHVLEGSIRRSGDLIRVTAQFIDGATGYHNWSRTYERPIDDIFGIQQEIASAVANELQITLSVGVQEQLRANPTNNIDAYIFYLQGIDRLRDSTDADAMTTAIQLFESAIAIDEGFSSAYGGICEAHLRLYEISNETSAFEAAGSACEEANRLDSGLNEEIRLALAKLYRYGGSLDQAEAQIDRAIGINPESADAYIELGEIRSLQADAVEAEAAFLRAVDLKRHYWKAYEALATFYYTSSPQEENKALEYWNKAVENFLLAAKLAPDVASTFAGLGGAYWMLGDYDNARDAYDESLALKPSRQGYSNMGLQYYYAGEFESAVDMQQLATELAPADHRSWGRLAESYRFVEGHENEARAAYQRAAELAEANLEIDPTDSSTIGLLGLYYAHLDRLEDSERLVNESVALSNGNAETLYYQALSRLVSGDISATLDSLEAAVSSDTRYRQFLGTDPDLKQLADHPRFRSLLSGNSN